MTILTPVAILKHVLDERLDLIFLALADVSRRTLIERLVAGPASVSTLAAPLDMSLSAVLQHVRVLESCGLISSEKVGRVRTCQIESEGLRQAEQWLKLQRTQWEVLLERLDDYLDDGERR